MLVSIITPNYNYGKFIGKTIESVLNQDYPKIEHIIVDGGSTDDSLNIIHSFLEKYPTRIRLIKQKKRGQTEALIEGFRFSSGEILNWLCSDDLIEPRAVSIAVEYFRSHPSVGLIYGDKLAIDEVGHAIDKITSPPFYKWLMRIRNPIFQESSFWRRNLYFEIGELDSSLEYCMDIDLFIRFSKITQIKHLPIIIGKMRYHNQSKTVTLSKKFEKYHSYDKELEKVHKKYFGHDQLILNKLLGLPASWIFNILMKYERFKWRRIKEKWLTSWEEVTDILFKV